MQCPKCHTVVDDNETVCPKCRKVLLLECPNCHSLGESSICEKCGYTILVKCSKCSKIVPLAKELCRCGYPTATSVAQQECETDEFASVIIKFEALKTIKKQLKSTELYTKFYIKLKNLLYSQIKGIDCKFITYDNTFVVNFNKELSFTTSSNKALRFALKTINAFSSLNANITEELSTPLNLVVTIIKKSSEDLLKLSTINSNVKPLTIKKNSKKYLRGLQIVLDQFVRDEVNKDYKNDSLYSIENQGKSIMYYEIILDSYVLPPQSDETESTIQAVKKDLKKMPEKTENNDLYSFKVFDINAKCSFKKISTVDFFDAASTLDLNKNGKIITLKTSTEKRVSSSDLISFYKKNGYKVLYITCTEQLSYQPWGFFKNLFKDYFEMPFHNRFNNFDKINPNYLKTFKPLFDLTQNKAVKAMTPEDARFTYMELWGKFLSSLKNTVIIIDNFENLDDTSIQTLELYFDKFKNVKPNFAFIASDKTSVHSKIKGLLRTDLYTEFSLQNSSIDSCLSTLKSDATDFIQSFYFEKIKENFNGSYLYFKNAIQYLQDCGILIDFENKLLIKNKKSVIIPKDLSALYKARIKFSSKNSDISFIFAYSSLLGARIDLNTLSALGIKNIETQIKTLIDSNFIIYNNNCININDFSLIEPIVTSSLKKEAEIFLSKNIIAQLGKGLDDMIMAMVMGRMGLFKDEYLTLWKNSQFSIKTGDYDAYLKNCLGFLTLIEHIESNISQEEIEENKKEVYNNILLCLYNYSPAKIYFIEKILLMDAIKSQDDNKIVKLSNLMLQGALISSNYTEAIGLLHNILSRMPNPTLITNGEINTKFLLLSLVNIEILYNIGEFRQCAEIADEILSILSPEVLEIAKPASFSTNLFISHILETFKLVGFAKLYLLDDDLEIFFEKIQNSLNIDLPERDCIIAVKDFLAGKVYSTGNIEEYSAFSKVIFLILQEFSILDKDYKRFAQNIYQAKLLASDIHQKEIDLFCDLLIANAYFKLGILEKAEAIYKDVLNTAEQTAMFNLLILSKYFLAQLKRKDNTEEALLEINDSLALIRKYNNQAQILFGLLEKLYIDIAIEKDLKIFDIECENQKLTDLKEHLIRILE